MNSMRCDLRFERLEARDLLASYYVATDGNDTQTAGSLDAPFATIGRASKFAQPGDTIFLRGGVYREQVELARSGTAGSPITFQAYGNEDVRVTTTEVLSGWTQHSGNIYKASFDSNLRGRNGFTLFANGQLMTEAHWSDQGGNVNTLVSSNFASMGGGDKNSFTDSALVGLPDDYWNGAFVWAQTSDFTMEARRIADFDGSTGRITLARSFDRDPRSGDKFLIYDHLNALNAPGEWYFDEATDTVYFWAPNGGDPDSYLVEAKVRDEGFDLNGNDYIHIKNIDFQGGDIDMTGSDGVLLQGAHIVAPNRGFGPEGSGGAEALDVNGSGNVIRDNEIEYAWATVARFAGDDNHFINNYVHHAGFNNSNTAVVSLVAGAERSLISHNTIEHIGRAAIGGVGGVRSVIQYNDVSRVAQMTADVGAIYLLNNSLGNSVIHHNVFHDITAKLSNGVYLDNNASDVAVHHNITYNTSAFGGKINLPNSYVLWFNNTHYSSGTIDAWGPSTSRDSSTGSKFFNNIISSLDSDLTNSADPAEASNNVYTSSSGNFIDAAAGDFRLRSTSAAVDAGRVIAGVTDGFTGTAPDAGALELGQAMWDFGHNFATPPTPIYQWSALPFSNRVENPSFDAGLDNWTAAAGTPSRYTGNAWNYRADALAIVGTGSLELKPGDRLEQEIDGLLPNTTYTVSGFARLVKDLQLESNDGTNGSFSSGIHRDERYIGDVQSGEWVKFNAVDFGSGTPFYDRIEIGTLGNSALSVQLRLDGPTGQLIGTLSVPSRGEPWFVTRANISSVTGVHDLYVVFQGNGGVEGKFDRIRLLNTNESERVTLGIKHFDAQGSTIEASIGSAYWAAAPQSLTFKTGPTATKATIYLAKQGGHLNGYVDTIAFTGDAFQTPVPFMLELVVDPISGSAVLRNNTASAISFDGYRIADSGNALRPKEWISLEDQAYDGGIWFEAGAGSETGVFVSQLAELTSIDSTTLNAGQAVYLGALVEPSLSAGLIFEYFLSDTLTLTVGLVRLEDPGLPELPGDYNGDLTVNLADYTVWRSQLGSETESFSGSDGNGDGMVNASDYHIWKRHFGDTVVAPVSFAHQTIATPESTSLDVAEAIVTADDASWPPARPLSYPHAANRHSVASGHRLFANEASESVRQTADDIMPFLRDPSSRLASAPPRTGNIDALYEESQESDPMHTLDAVFACWESTL